MEGSVTILNMSTRMNRLPTFAQIMLWPWLKSWGHFSNPRHPHCVLGILKTTTPCPHFRSPCNSGAWHVIVLCTPGSWRPLPRAGPIHRLWKGGGSWCPAQTTCPVWPWHGQPVPSRSQTLARAPQRPLQGQHLGQQRCLPRTVGSPHK